MNIVSNKYAKIKKIEVWDCWKKMEKRQKGNNVIYVDSKKKKFNNTNSRITNQ